MGNYTLCCVDREDDDLAPTMETGTKNLKEVLSASAYMESGRKKLTEMLSAETSTGIVVCSNCGGRGHTAKSCPSTKAYKVKATGRIGHFSKHDPTNDEHAFRLIFYDGAQPESEWFAKHAVELAVPVMEATNFDPKTFETQPADRRKGLRGVVDNVIVPDEDDRDFIFQAARHAGVDIFFQHLRIRPDGGLGQSNLMERLYDGGRVASVVVCIFYVILNMYTVFSNAIIVWAAAKEDAVNRTDLDFVLLIPSGKSAKTCVMAMQLSMAGVEVFAMLAMLSYSVYVVVRFNFFLEEEDMKHYRIYHQLYVVCCQMFLSMTNFSAMRALSILNPQVATTEFWIEMTKVEEGASHARVIVVFLVSRLAVGILGFLAFSIKFAHLVVQLQQTELKDWSGSTEVYQVVLLFGFINQFFGITQIASVEMARVFLVFFGGEDAAMQAGELDRQEVFLGFVVYTVLFKTFTDKPPWQRKLQRAIALLSFSHFDVQSLVLDEDDSMEVDVSKSRKDE